MGTKLFLTGIWFMFVANAVLSVFGWHGSAVLTSVGAIIATVGLVLKWLDK